MNSLHSLSSNLILTPTVPAQCSIKLIGLGGVGGIVARYLALFLASLPQESRLVFIDGDSFESTNANRMYFGNGGNKAVVVRDELLPRFANAAFSLLAIEEYITPQNISRLVHNGDLVLLSVDNHATRKLINDYCAHQLADICLISGGNDGVETTADGKKRRGTFGNVQVYWRQAGTELSPSLTRFHPEIQDPVDLLPTQKNCTELFTSVPQILFANLTVAAAMLNTLWLYWCGALHYSELAFDIAEGLMRPVPLSAPKLPPPRHAPKNKP